MTNKDLQESSIISLASTQVLIDELKQRAIKKEAIETASNLDAGINVDVEFIAILISLSEIYGRVDEIRLQNKGGHFFTYPINML